MNPNPEQIKAIVRWLVAVFGAAIAGWFAHSGYVTSDQIMSVLNSPAFLGIAVSIISGFFSLWTHTQSNAVAVVTKIAANPASPVVGVVTSNTMEGRALANSLPHNEIAVANSTEANNIALDSVPPMKEKDNP